MLCYKCGKNEATVKVLTDYNGNPNIKYYCRTCYDEYKMASAEGIHTEKCPVCGKQWGDVEASLRFGCVQCIKADGLRPKLDLILNKMQGASIHIGKSIDDILVEDKEEYVSRLANESVEAANGGNVYLAEQLKLQLRYFKERNGL